MNQLTATNIRNAIETGYLPSKRMARQLLQYLDDTQPSDEDKVNLPWRLSVPAKQAVEEYLGAIERGPEAQLAYAIQAYLYVDPHQISLTTAKVLDSIPTAENEKPVFHLHNLPGCVRALMPALLRERIFVIDSEDNVSLSEEAIRQINYNKECANHLDRAKKIRGRIYSRDPQGSNISWSMFIGHHRVLYEPLIKAFSDALKGKEPSPISSRVNSYHRIVMGFDENDTRFTLPEAHCKAFQDAVRKLLIFDNSELDESRQIKNALARQGVLSYFRIKSGIQEVICFNEKGSRYIRASWQRFGEELAAAFASSIVTPDVLMNADERPFLLAATVVGNTLNISTVVSDQASPTANMVILDPIKYKQCCNKIISKESARIASWLSKNFIQSG